MKFSPLAALALVAALPSCSFLATPFTGARQSVTITASDPEAEIWVDGEKKGRGPITVRLSRKSTHRIDAALPDGRNGNAWLHSSTSTFGVIDTIFGSVLILPLFGLLFPGAWTLEPGGDVEVRIPPLPGAEPEAFSPPPMRR